VNWVHPAQNRIHWLALMNREMNLQVLLKVRNFFTRGVTISFSKTLLNGISLGERK